MSGIKGKSGRKPTPKNVTQYLYTQIDMHWKDLVASLISKAIEGDREAMFYCFDRKLGKPKAYSHFKASVKNDTDLSDFKKAMNNYIAHIKAEKTENKFIQHGSTFFNKTKWGDWIKVEKPKGVWGGLAGN